MSEFILLARAQDLLVDLLKRTARWPRRLRGSLVGRVETAAVELVACIACAQAARGDGRRIHVEVADQRLAVLRVLLRAAGDLKLLSAGAQAHVGAQVDEVGRLLGGWQKAEARTAGAASPR